MQKSIGSNVGARERSISEIRIIGIIGVPEVKPGDNLGGIIVKAIKRQKVELQDSDIIVVTSKIVSKAEGRIVKLNNIKPSNISLDIGERWKKDPRLVETVLSESKRVVRMDRRMLITETKHGFICANSGVDQSNVSKGSIVLLPVNSDSSAESIREAVKKLAKVDVAVIVSDTFGRPWRTGQVDVALGVSGMKPLIDYRGTHDPYGYELKVTAMAVADEIASAAELVMGKINQVPVVVIKGCSYTKGEGSVRELIRHPSRDLFR
jgi:coenzyme F420-0:L-glutamate ligase/coenzyme F420-1:gamma-L-glutamate ligase